MIEESELAKDLERVMMQPNPKPAPRPPFKVVDMAKEDGQSAKMLKQMREIIGKLQNEIEGYVQQREALTRKIIDTNAALVASQAAAQVLSLVDNHGTND